MARSNIGNLRILVLGALFFTALITGSIYLARQREARRTPSHVPTAIPREMSQIAHDFAMSRSEGGKTIFRATAKKAVDYRDSGKSQLEGVEIFIYGSKGDRKDHITTDHADYDSNSGLFYSEGQVTIQLASVPGADPTKQATQPMIIKTTGLLFDQKKNTATTDRPLQFEFRQGHGTAKGAIYDSEQRTLWLRSDVNIHLERGEPMDIRAAEMRYFETAHQVQMTKPEFKRVHQVMASDKGFVFLDEKQQAKNGTLEGNVHGTIESDTPNKPRTTDFSANKLDMQLDDKQQVTNAVATGNARMDSHGATGRSQGQADRLDMDLTGPKSALKQARWSGGSKVIFTPPPTATARAQTRIITADQIEMNMTADGKEVANARTLTPGRVEMLGGSEPKRVMTAKQIWADFGDRNTIHQMRATGQVRTESDPPSTAPAGSAQRITTSETLSANFNAQQQLEAMSQSGNFQYREGDRQAAAELAVYTTPGSNQPGVTVLTGKPGADPRVWDAQGSVIAQKITMPEAKADNSGETVAEGDVRATQLAKSDPKKPDAAKTDAVKKDDPKEPIHVVTNRLRSERKTGFSHYEGGPGGKVRLWQGQDVIEARNIDMERAGKDLTATGDVYTLLVEKEREPLRVYSDRFHYNDDDRQAHYEGHVIMKSQDMTVVSNMTDAFLRAPDEVQPGESRLYRAVAVGKVRMNQPVLMANVGKRKAHPAREGSAERAVYTTDDDKIVLTGGPPIVKDSVRGTTTGRELTWLTADDKILVDGSPEVRTLTQHMVTKKQK